MKERTKILVLPAQLVSTKRLLIILHYSCYNIHGGWVIIRIKTKTNPWIATFRDSNDERGRKARDTCGLRTGDGCQAKMADKQSFLVQKLL